MMTSSSPLGWTTFTVAVNDTIASVDVTVIFVSPSARACTLPSDIVAMISSEELHSRWSSSYFGSAVTSKDADSPGCSIITVGDSTMCGGCIVCHSAYSVTSGFWTVTVNFCPGS